jgi:hypothetical protein
MRGLVNLVCFFLTGVFFLIVLFALQMLILLILLTSIRASWATSFETQRFLEENREVYHLVLDSTTKTDVTT